MLKKIGLILVIFAASQHFVYTLRVNRNYDTEPPISKKILNFINKYNMANNDRNNAVASNFKNVELVKRLLPHGHKRPSYSYDPKFNTLYKPLIRVHLNKNKRPVKNTGLPINTFAKHNNVPVKYQNLIDFLTKKKSRPKLTVVIVKVGKDQIDKGYLRQVGRESEELASDINHRQLKNAQAIALTNAKDVEYIGVKYVPAYPFWNYWTYKNTVNNPGNCPDSLILAGGHCISKVHHRK